MKYLIAAVAIAAVALFASFARAATVTLQSPDSTATCTYSNFALNNGDYTFQCVKPTPPATNCPSRPVRDLPPPNKGQVFSLARGEIASFPVPAAKAGYVQVFQTTDTPVATTVEIWFSVCPGDLNDQLRNQTATNQWGGSGGKPCVKSYGYTGGPVYWNKAGNSPTVCKVPEGSYVNYRNTACPNSSCPMTVQVNITAP